MLKTFVRPNFFASLLTYLFLLLGTGTLFVSSTNRTSAQTIAQGQGSIQVNPGDFANDFELVSSLQIVTTNDVDPFGQSRPTKAIEFIAAAKRFITPLGYWAIFYDAQQIEIGRTIIECIPGGSIQPGERIRCNVLPLTPGASVVVFKRL